MKRKIAEIANYCFLIILIAFLAYGWINVGNRSTVRDAATERQTVEPANVLTLPDGGYAYTLDIDEVSRNYHSLIFYTNHQKVQVVEHGQTIYTLEPIDSVYGHTTGSVWNSVEIEPETASVVVYIEPVYDDVEFQDVEFFMSDTSAVYIDMISDDLGNVAIAFFIFAIGICMIVYHVLGRKNVNHDKAFMYLGIFTILLGIWSFLETCTATIILNNRPMSSYLSFTILSIIGVPMVLFANNFLRVLNRYLYRIVYTIMGIIALAVHIMQFAGIRDVKQNDVLIHATMITAMAFYVYAIIASCIHQRYVRRAVASIAGLVVMLVPMFFDLASYYMGKMQSASYGMVGFLLFVLILAVETFRDNSEALQKERNIEMYQQMAVKDVLTDCYNRNAYEEDAKELTDNHVRSVVFTFDLNNLKKCNDTLGHKMGDKYIVECASMIKEVFGGQGKIYRIGGDEFCVITKYMTRKKSDKLKAELLKKQDFFNAYQDQLKVGIAVGISLFNPAELKSIDEARAKADKNMYDNKKEMKANDQA